MLEGRSMSRRTAPTAVPRQRTSHHASSVASVPSTWVIAEARRFADINHRAIIRPIQAKLDDHPGETAQLPWRSLLIAYLILGLQGGQRMHTRQAWQVLLSLPEKTRRQLRVIDDKHVVTYAQITHLYRRVVKVAADLTTDADPDGHDGPAFMSWLVEQLIAGSIPKDQPLSKNVAVDSTDIWTWARTVYEDDSAPTKGKRKGSPKGKTPTDPDAGRGHRPSRNDWSAGVFSGYDAHLFVTARDSNERVPLLIESMAFTKAGANRGNATMPTLTRLHERRPIETLYADRGYSMLTWEYWGEPLAQLGIQHYIDYSTDQRNKTGVIQGALLLDGWLYSPSLPEGLKKLDPISTGLNAAERASRIGRFDERAQYAFREHNRDADGYLRLKAPCHAGQVRCPLVPSSLGLSLKRPTVNHPRNRRHAASSRPSPCRLCTSAKAWPNANSTEHNDGSTATTAAPTSKPSTRS
jgi:hypothetical protein